MKILRTTTFSNKAQKAIREKFDRVSGAKHILKTGGDTVGSNTIRKGLKKVNDIVRATGREANADIMNGATVLGFPGPLSKINEIAGGKLGLHDRINARGRVSGTNAIDKIAGSGLHLSQKTRAAVKSKVKRLL